MNVSFLSALLFTFGFLSWGGLVCASERLPAASVLEPAEAELSEKQQASEDEEVLDYRALIREVERLRSDTNQVRAEDNKKRLEQEVVGKLFQLSDTVKVKRNVLISQDMAFFFEPISGQDVILSIMPKHKHVYAGIEEHDFVTARARCLELGERFLFKMEEIVEISPFDGAADFLNYNDWIQAVAADREGRLYLEYKDHLSSEVNQNKGQLGFVTGIMLSLTRDRRSGLFVMKMKTDDGQFAHIKCHRSYLQVLRDLQTNSRVSMAVRLETADAKNNYYFRRGCLIKLRD